MNQTEAKDFVQDLVSKTAKRFKQELEGENEEFLDRVLRKFNAKIARHSWKASQKWSKWDEEGPVLMPDFTRIYYRKGMTEVLVQELPPQIRLMKFKTPLVTRSSTDDAVVGDKDQVHHFSLALPYVVFLHKFVNGKFVEVRCAFNDRPMNRLEERPLRPYLSNIDTNLGVCLGTFNKDELVEGNVTQQAAYVLDHFWHSAYTDEWATHYWNSKAHFTENNDKRMASLDAWQDASTENPLFVVEDVNWLKYQEESFGDMIVRMFEGDQQNSALNEELYNDLVKEFFEDLKKTFGENVESIGEKMGDSLVDQLTDQLMEKL